MPRVGVSVPALGLISAAGEFEQATEAFTRRYPGRSAIGAQWSQIEAVLRGELGRAELGGPEFRIEVDAATDQHGTRLALLTISSTTERPEAGPANALLAEPLDEVPAIVWIKDLEGRYLRVNRTYCERLQTSESELLGRADPELPLRIAIDGPRLAAGRGASEPLELEYTIDPVQGRPGLVALRFAVRDASARAVAVCGVAAPANEAAVARSECASLMRVERWNRSDPASVREELLERWRVSLRADAGMTPIPVPVGPAPLGDERAAALARCEELRAQLDRACARAEDLERALAAERESSLALRGDIAAALAEVERVRMAASDLPHRHAGAQAAVPADSSSPRWTPNAQRAFATALAGMSDWRSALKDAVKVLRAHGGWGAAAVWSPDDRGEVLKCSAMCVDPAADLDAFETLSWQRPQRISGTALGRALHLPRATIVDDLTNPDDARLTAARRQGLGRAVLVPIRDGVVTVAMLELFSRSPAAPDPDTIAALEAVALQLGQVAHLLRLTATPHWRLGRL